MRDQAFRTAESDPIAAAKLARRIEDPWFACQAMAAAVRYGPAESIDAWFAEALKTASRNTDQYNVVAASAWPVAAGVIRDLNQTHTTVVNLVRESKSVTPSSSRSEALFLLLQAVWDHSRNLREHVFEAFVTACLPVEHWRQRRNLVDGTVLMAASDMKRARAVVDRVEDGRTRRRLERELGTREAWKRSFFR